MPQLAPCLISSRFAVSRKKRISLSGSKLFGVAPSIAFRPENRYNETVTRLPGSSYRGFYLVPVSPFIPAFFLASGASALSNRIADALFDNTFNGLYRLQPFDWALLVPYFGVLIVLSVYGLHRYALIR